MSLIHAHAGPCLPSLWSDAMLVYWRADPNTQQYLDNPLELMLPDRNDSLVVVSPLREVRELPCSRVVELDAAMTFLFRPDVAAACRRVVTIHAKAMLGRLARWHALKTGATLPPCLHPLALVDLVELVNAPAVMAYPTRRAFRVYDYIELLALTPEVDYDQETGLILNLLKRYGC